jgi:hypothetical protein
LFVQIIGGLVADFFIFFVSFLDFEERDVEIPVTNNKKTLLSASQPNPTFLHSLGKGTLMTNAEIVELLRKPPKSVPMLRTKTSFQDFFKGIDMIRFRSLLHEAFDNIIDFEERENKVNRRMELMEAL